MCTHVIRTLCILQGHQSSLLVGRLAIGKKNKSFVLGHQRWLLGELLLSRCQRTGASAVQQLLFVFESFCLYFRTEFLEAEVSEVCGVG